MFDSEFADLDDAALVAAIAEGARAEAAAAARRLAAIAALAGRKLLDDDERNTCAFDPWDSVAAEVAAAMTVGHRRASGQMRIAVALRDRLPRVAALFERGALSARVVSAITWRTQLVEDEAVALIDAALADRASRLGPLSEYRLHDALDTIVERYDPDAVRATQTSARTRDFNVGDIDDPTATTSVWGRLLATDAAVLKRRVDVMAHAVCEQRPAHARRTPRRRARSIGRRQRPPGVRVRITDLRGGRPASVQPRGPRGRRPSRDRRRDPLEHRRAAPRRRTRYPTREALRRAATRRPGPAPGHGGAAGRRRVSDVTVARRAAPRRQNTADPHALG